MPDFIPIEHDPFAAGAGSGELQPAGADYPFQQAAPAAGNIVDPASQYRSPWADSPLAALGRSLPGFWKAFYEKYAAVLLGGVDGGGGYKTEPVEHDPFAATTIAAGSKHL